MIKPKLLIFFVFFCLALSFAAFTNHAWEDYYITYRCSKNLATGNGLVYTPGERVHAFTSPLNVLVPALINYISADSSDELVLWIFRLLSASLLALAAINCYEIAKKLSFNKISIIFLLGLLATDAKTIDFTINGQEAAFMVFFLSWMFRTLMVSDEKITLKLALSWAGLMWTRPDGFIYFGSVALGFLLFPQGVRFARSRKELLAVYVKATLLSMILYCPWFVWAWSYYGSPIPHTIVAKGLTFSPPDLLGYLQHFLLLPFNAIFGDTSADAVFTPAYAHFGGWPAFMFLASKAASFFCLIFWLLPTKNYSVRSLSVGFYISLFYISYIANYPYPWYIPNIAIMSFVILALSADRIFTSIRSIRLDKVRSAASVIFKFIVSVSLIFAGIVLCLTAYQLRIQQHVIENGVRQQIGLWLLGNAAKGDTVFLEPSGYIGFYSNLKLYDFPGLTSLEVVAARKKLRSNQWKMLIEDLKPDWVVRRWYEATDDETTPAYLDQSYTSVKTFDAMPAVNSYRFLPGRYYLYHDSVYTVYKRDP